MSDLIDATDDYLKWLQQAWLTRGMPKEVVDVLPKYIREHFLGWRIMRGGDDNTGVLSIVRTDDTNVFQMTWNIKDQGETDLIKEAFGQFVEKVVPASELQTP